MGNLWLKIKIWTKLTAFTLVLLYVIVFVAKNSAKDVNPGPWFWFNVEPRTTVLMLVLYAFLSGVVATLLIRTTANTLRQIREARERTRRDKMERELADMKEKADRLQTKPVSADGGGAA